MKRELILGLMSKGRTSKQISDETGIPLATIRYYREKSKSGPKIVAKISEHRRKLKRKAIAYSGGSCLKCGYDVCDAALTFHHLDPGAKELAIASGSTKSWPLLKEEVDKTILLCCRCHSEHHAGLWCPDTDMIERQTLVRGSYADVPLQSYCDC